MSILAKNLFNVRSMEVEGHAKMISMIIEEA